MKYFKQLLTDYVYELSTADVLLTVDNKLCFNAVRGRKLLLKKLIDMEYYFLEAVRGRSGWDIPKIERLAGYLKSMEQMFSFQEDNLIWHKHLDFRCESGPIEGLEILLQWKTTLSGYFTIQYESLQRLKNLLPCETFILPGCYGWNTNIIALYELLNVLWETLSVIPFGKISKKAYFSYFFNVFGVQEKTENYHVRIIESVNRKDEVHFLHKLIERYKEILADRDR